MLAEICPDANGYLGHLNSTTSGQKLLRMFGGVNPWMVSCWACLFTPVQLPSQRAAFRQADARFWKLSRQLKERHGDVEPNMKSLAAILTAEQGKTLADAEGDVFRGLEVVEHAAAVGNL